MLPEVEAYVTAVDAAHTGYEDAMRAARDVYYEASRTANHMEASRAHDAEESRQRRLRNARSDLAWAELGMSPHPLIQWIVNNIATDDDGDDDFTDHAEQIMKILPANYAEIKAYGENAGWCGDFGRLLARAVQDGVIDDGMMPARRNLDARLASILGANSSHYRAIAPLVDALVSAVAEEATRPAPKQDAAIQS